MHFLKEGQKNRAWVDPPPIIRAMPERKRFFSADPFPYITIPLTEIFPKEYLVASRIPFCYEAI